MVSACPESPDAMRAEKPAGVRYGTQALALVGFTETLSKTGREERGGIQSCYFYLPGNCCRGR